MPELPEVETTLRAIEKFKNQRLSNIKVHNRNLRWKVDKDLEINSKNQIIELKGNVKIINQGSVIMGSQGINNIKTGISKITGNKKQRVKGTFSPKKKIKKGKKNE